jgi:mono/diheme cytochrome c family protein
MMTMRSMLKLIIVLAMVLFALSACYPNPAPPGLTPIPTLAPGVELTPIGTVEAQAIVAPAAQVTAGAGAALPAGNEGQGAAIFTKNCTPCHGQGGQGGGSGPKLVGDKFVQAGPDQNIYNVIANGRPGTAMPAWSKANPPLSDQQIYDLIAYVKSLQK